jgi:uncharacterized protein (TIGR03083 family)
MVSDQLTDLPRDKAELLERIEQARAALDQTIAHLSDAQLVAPGPYEGWSVKDHLAHLAAWEQGIAALLQRRPRYAAMGVDAPTNPTAGTDGINAVIYQRDKDRPLAEVLADFRQAQQALLAALAPLSDADLLKTYSHYQPDEPGKDSGAPILKWVASNTYEHYAEHVAWLVEHAQLQS